MQMTQKDIARGLGISLITVSRALNGTGYVSKELKDRILSYAKEHEYVPHKASQVLVRNKIRTIVLFSSSLPAYFWNDIRKGVQTAAKEIMPFNYVVRYHTIAEFDTEAYITLLKQEINSGLDAVGFVNQRKYDMQRIIETIKAAGIPFVTFNTDAPESGRLRYIGSNYAAGGALAANFIGNTLLHSPRKRVLVINVNEHEYVRSEEPDINAKRLAGFERTMQHSFPDISCETVSLTSQLQEQCKDTQIEDLLREYKGSIEAVYLIPAFNTTFLEALERLDYRGTITVLHDIDTAISRYLEHGVLTAAIYQNPVLQGYYGIKTLEYILESKQATALPDIEITHNLILAENRDLLRTHNIPEFTR